jgi:hypothetical protein
LFFFFLFFFLRRRADVPVLALPLARMASRVTYRLSTIKALFRLYYGSVLAL